MSIRKKVNIDEQEQQEIDQQSNPSSSESDYKNTFSSILQGNEEFVLSSEGIILGSNLEAVNLTGYEEWEVIGKHFSLFYSKEEIANNLPTQHLIETEQLGELIIEGWKLRKRGAKFYARLRFMVKKNALSEFVGYRMVLTDVTHKVIYDGKLKKIKEKYLGIYNNSFVGIITFSAIDYHIIQLNKKAKEILGSKTENFNEIFNQNDDFSRFCEELKTSADGILSGYDFKISSERKEEKWVSLDCKKHGDVVEGVVVEITRIKKQELEIVKLTNEVNTFIYHASHELRAPISTILGILNLFSLDNDPSIIMEYVSMIRERVRAQDQLLKDLTSVIYNNSAPISTEVIDIRQEILEILSEFKDVYGQIKTKVNVSVLSNFISDTLRLRSVIRNILSNSFKYHSPVNPRIEIKVTESEDTMNISISDNGMGMSDDQLVHVFNLFYRANQGFPGNGLGLYLVKSTLNILKGEIILKSKKGKGTKVLIKLKKHHLLNEN